MKNYPLEAKNTEVIKFIVEDRFRPLRYALFLIGSLVIICFTNQVTDYASPYRYYRLATIYTTIVLLSFINMKVLVPRLFFKGKYFIYFFLLFLVVLGGLALLSNILSLFSQEHPTQIARDSKGGLYEGIIMLSPIILVTTMIKLFQRWIKDTAHMAELNNIGLSMELNSLKNQINPHFLFNMLNGIKALVRIDQERAAAVIIKLSELLRYQLYENNDPKTLLKAEIEFLKNFLELEKIRRDDLSVEVITQNDIQAISNVYLPPGLFTVFVENAVKHSVDISQKPSYINIEIAVEGAVLYFSCANSVDPHYKSSQKSNGLGLVNITRRLQLLYEGHYTYTVSKTETEYLIHLILPL